MPLGVEVFIAHYKFSFIHSYLTHLGVTHVTPNEKTEAMDEDNGVKDGNGRHVDVGGRPSQAGEDEGHEGQAVADQPECYYRGNVDSARGGVVVLISTSTCSRRGIRTISPRTISHRTIVGLSDDSPR